MTKFTLPIVLLLAFCVSLSADQGAEKKSADGWIQLFNGKDLTGWKTHPQGKAKWEVKDGILIGTGPKGHLFTERDDYDNFRFRVEAMINDKGNSGMFFRAKFVKTSPPGYEAQINATHVDRVKTGSLYHFPDCLVLDHAPHKPNEWFTQEVIADGNHIIIKVNDKVTVDKVIPSPKYLKGHLAIQQHDPGTIIKVRKIEYMPLK